MIRGMKYFIKMFKNLNFDTKKCREVFDIQLKEILKSAENVFFGQNYSVNLEYLKLLLNEPENSQLDLIKFLKNNKVTIEDLIRFKNEIFKNGKLKWLIQGNITKEQALNLVNEVHETMEIDINKEKIGLFRTQRVVKFYKNNNYIFRTKSPNENEINSSLISVYQCGLLNLKDNQYLRIVNSYLKEKFYSQLRTNENLGYIVSSLVSVTGKVYFQLFIVQSSSYTPEYCAGRVRNFIKELTQKIKSISDEEFKEHVNSLYVIDSKKDYNLNEAVIRNWEEIKENTYVFDRKEKSCNILKNECNKEEFIKFFEKYFVDEPAILDSELLCNSHYEENEKIMKETKIEDNGKIENRIICDSIIDFKEINELYPIYNNSLFMNLKSKINYY
jgi:secreted Zn-dependent insulinase-like peptidase